VLDAVSEVREVMAMGQWMLRNGEVVHYGTFEKESKD
jgi:hypothetical protein